MTEFKITGLGEYRTRDGRKAVVSHNDGGRYCWLGKIGEGIYNWNENGSFWATEIISVEDIIGPWEEAATVRSSSPKGESRSKDEATGNTACDEAGDAVTGSAKWAVTEVLSFCIDNAEHVSVYKTGLAKELIEMLSEQGFTIVRTSTLGNRNGCYNTRTDKDVD